MKRLFLSVLMSIGILASIAAVPAFQSVNDIPTSKSIIDQDHNRFIPSSSSALTESIIWTDESGVTYINDRIRITESVTPVQVVVVDDTSESTDEVAEEIDTASQEAVSEPVEVDEAAADSIVVDDTTVDEEEAEIVEEFINSRQGFSVNLEGHMLFVRNSDRVYGASTGMSLGFEHFMVGFYGRGDYFSKPLGAASGIVAKSEFAVEGGINVAYAAPLFRWLAIKAGGDIGYFAQVYQRPEYEKLFILGQHGLIGRASLAIDLSIGSFDLEAGAFMQAAFSTKFRSYDGYGFFVRIY